jgi:hypothetical protein
MEKTWRKTTMEEKKREIIYLKKSVPLTTQLKKLVFLLKILIKKYPI